MSKIFRRFRQNFLKEGKTIQYLKYAVGEIVLVVIGILIALQINIWNENRKSNEAIESLISVFEKELEKNIIACNEFLEYGYETDSIASLYTKKKITKKMLAKNSDLRWGFGTFIQNFSDDHLNELISLEKQFPVKYAHLVTDLKELVRRIASQRNWEKKALDLSLSRWKEFADTQPWLFEENESNTEEALDYYLNNQFHRNKVLHYNSIQLGENVWDASLIRTTSTAILWKIKEIQIKEGKEVDSYSMEEDLFPALRLQPFKKLDCDKFPYEKIESIGFGRNFVLYNDTEKLVKFNIIDLNGAVTSSGKIKPKSFILDEFSLGANDLIQRLDENGNCEQIYRYTKEDFLIFY